MPSARQFLSRTVNRVIDRVDALRESSDPIARIAINMPPIVSSWGGGNQWVRQMTDYLRRNGYAVRFDLEGDVDCIILAEPRETAPISFTVTDIQNYRRRHPQTKCLHRINENDHRKGTDFMDKALAEANKVADYTVFISEWLRDYHAERWFNRSKAHTCIINGADTRVFHSKGSPAWGPGQTLRLVTHHWSDNWKKGFKVYQEIDELIATGKLPETELWIIGRWPAELTWKSARTFRPCQGPALANLLRQCHVYVTASLWEPGGMHFIEGAQCGLPLLYHEDGGGIVEVGRRFGIGFRENPLEAIHAMKTDYPRLRQAVLEQAPSGETMSQAYLSVIEKMLNKVKTIA